MKKTVKLFSVILAIIMIVCIVPVSSFAADTGLQKVDGVWTYYFEGSVDTYYTGMAKNDYGWWYVNEGYLDQTYTGLAANQYGMFYMVKGKFAKTTGMVKMPAGSDFFANTWVYLKDGKLANIDTDYFDAQYGQSYLTEDDIYDGYTGLAKNDYGWWYIGEGVLDTSYSGMAKNDYGWWHVTDGKLNQKYTGLSENEYGIWYVKNGKLDTSKNGFFKTGSNDFESSNTWVYAINGNIFKISYVFDDEGLLEDIEIFGYTGLAKNSYGTWYVEYGVLADYYTGLAKTGKNDDVKKNAWVYVENGKYNANFTGIASNKYGAWYMKNGALQTGYTGNVTYNGQKYVVNKGKVDIMKTFANLNEKMVAASLSDYSYECDVSFSKLYSANVTVGWGEYSEYESAYCYTVKVDADFDDGGSTTREKLIFYVMVDGVTGEALPMFFDYLASSDSITNNVTISKVSQFM